MCCAFRTRMSEPKAKPAGAHWRKPAGDHTTASRCLGVYFLRLPFSRWLRALAAAVFEVLLVRPSLSVFDAAEAAFALVTFLAM